MMFDRVSLARNLLAPTAVSCTTIDEYEVNNLAFILKQAMPGYSFRPVVIEYNHRGRVKSNFAVTHEYALWSIPKGKDLITRKRETSDDIRRNLRRTGTDSTRQASPNQFYGIEVDNSTLEIISVTPALELTQPIPVHTNPATTMVWPIDGNGIERRWYYGRNRVEKEAIEGTVWAKRIRGEIQIHYHQDGKPKMRKSVWVGRELDASTHGSELLNDIFGLGKAQFSFPKSIYAVRECIESMSLTPDSVFLDYFAGSGTTGHAVIEMNRDDGGMRKFVLVEMGNYFDSVLKPRIVKAVYANDWNDGKPGSRDTGISQCIKYIRLESYEDALNNLKLSRSEAQTKLLDTHSDLREEYMLSYMLDFETAGSQSMLNIGAFDKPDEYVLKIERDGRTRTVNVDLVETFNWLLGLSVKHMDVIRGVRVVDGTNPEGDRVLVLWRDTEKIDNDALNDWFHRQEYSTRDLEYDIIYVNGDNNLENWRREDQTWKVRLIEEDFHRLMFDTREL